MMKILFYLSAKQEDANGGVAREWAKDVVVGDVTWQAHTVALALSEESGGVPNALLHSPNKNNRRECKSVTYSSLSDEIDSADYRLDHCT